jgi:hypothetical protein
MAIHFENVSNRYSPKNEITLKIISPKNTNPHLNSSSFPWVADTLPDSVNFSNGSDKFVLFCFTPGSD